MNIFVPYNFVYLYTDFRITDFWSGIPRSKKVDRHHQIKILI